MNPGVTKTNPSEGAGQVHLSPGLQVLAVVHSSGEILVDGLERGDGPDIRYRVAALVCRPQVRGGGTGGSLVIPDRSSHQDDITGQPGCVVLLDSCEGLQGVTKDIKARVGRHPLRHVASVERINNTQERPKCSAGYTCLGWTERLYPDLTEIENNLSPLINISVQGIISL